MKFNKNTDPHKIIIQLQIRLKIALFLKLEHFKSIAQIKLMRRFPKTQNNATYVSTKQFTIL